MDSDRPHRLARQTTAQPTAVCRGPVGAIAALLAGGSLLLAPQCAFSQQSAANQPSGVTPEAANNLHNPATQSPPAPGNPLTAALDVEQMLSPTGLTSTLKVMLLLTVLSLAPSILMMTTCFIRFIIVLGLVRQALGTQQLPPNQVLISLCLFLTFAVMAPVWQESYEQGLRPYTSPQPGEVAPSLQTAFENTVRPIRTFMSNQIATMENEEGVLMLLRFQHPQAGADQPMPENYEDVPLSILLPAFMLSELKTAFTIGFMVYLPFVIIDMVISSVLISMGMLMLPPVLISLPFKLLLFVMIDGWFLTVGMMLESVHPP